MKELFSSLEYYEKINTKLTIRRSKYNDFIIVDNNSKNSIHNGIKDYMIIESKNGQRYIFLKRDGLFEMYKITDNWIWSVLYFEEVTFFKRKIEFYFDGFSIDSELKFKNKHAEEVNGKVIKCIEYNRSTGFKRYASDEFNICCEADSEVMLKALKITEFDTDPEVIILM